MKLLHTADLHIGKRLHQVDLVEDHRMFFAWLVEFIRKEGVEAVLVSGDVFDLAHPSAEARQTYYQLLAALCRMRVQVILTGGNHDSPGMLHAPQELLSMLDIRVVGSMPERWDEVVVPLGRHGAVGTPSWVVAAVPFLRDSDWVGLAAGQSTEDRLALIREGVRSVYHGLGEQVAAAYPGIPAIAMGHLFAQGSQMSDSEREIQVGNLAGIEATAFGPHWDYVALGHIHRPQQVGSDQVRYSGSPLPLSFSEYEDPKQVLVLEADAGGRVHAVSHAVPVFRRLLRIEGDLPQLQHDLARLPPPGPLPSLIELTWLTQSDAPGEDLAFENMIREFNDQRQDARIVKSFIRREGIRLPASHFLPDAEVDRLQPSEVLQALFESQSIPADEQFELRAAFQMLLDALQQEQTGPQVADQP